METPRILIVDDEQDTRASLKNCLSPRIQCEIIEASNAYEAIEKIESTGIDLILLDIHMPGISGTNVIKKAKEKSKDIAVIVITKLDSSDLAKQIEQSGAMYIPKPFSLKVVHDEVKKKLEGMNKYAAKKKD